MPLDSSGSAEAILETIAACTDALCLDPAETLAVAIPDPFDYQAGIARFEGVGKFDSLAGIDLRQVLLDLPARPPGRVTFVNDAEAFGRAECFAGSARGYRRAVAITLGTGIGSAFLDAGRIVCSGPSVPPEGHLYRLVVGGRSLEESVSRRAIIAGYRHLGAPSWTSDRDVRDIAAAALSGDGAASRVFVKAFRHLGEALAPWLAHFGAEVLVVGGGMSASWTLVTGPLRTGLGDAADDIVIVRSADTENAIAVGAAWPR